MSTKPLAIVSGLIGFIAFILVPFLPVDQQQSSLHWPQDSAASSVNAPLFSYVPEQVELTIPAGAADALRPDQDLVLTTVPTDAEDAVERALTVTALDDGGYSVVARGELVAETPAGQDVTVSSTEDATIVRAGGQEWELEDDNRPMVTGVYSELESAPAGLAADVEINSRFTTSPTVLKQAAMWVGGIALLIALVCLWRLDREAAPAAPARRRFRFIGADAVVLPVLGLWHIFGANTADDGYILTMARLADDGGYMANYYRWFGVPESPFGWPYYDLLAAMTHVSTASTWMRLPALASAVVMWFVISRVALPRVGATRKLAVWSAAMVFLAFWMPYNNGTRPEPVVACGALLTWAVFEYAIARKRLFPAAIGVMLAATTLAAAPTGLMAVGAFLIALPALIRVLKERGNALANLAPFLAAGTAILAPVFGTQSFAAVMEATAVRSEIGPSLPWYLEIARYQSLLSTESVDGSFTRRFAMLMLGACVAIVCLCLLRYRQIPGVHNAPTIRLILVVFGAVLFMTFTPTKWTHHFGVYAGIAPVVAAVAAVALAAVALRVPRARWFIVGGFLLLFALSLAGANAWWYVSSFGVPWWDKSIQFKGVEAASVMLLIAVVVLIVGAVPHRPRFSTVAAAPIAVLSALVVAFSGATMAKAFVSQYPAYTVGLGNLRDLKGETCALANDIRLETNTNESFLQPVDGELGASLSVGASRGFTPDGISDDLESENEGPTAAIAEQVTSDSQPEGQDTGTMGGERESKGVNGSTKRLPFALDYTRVPVLGSWKPEEATQTPAELTTQWYRLPAASEDAPLLVVSVAGRIAHHDRDGILQDGQDLTLEYGTLAGGSVRDTGEIEMYDIGPEPSWRNLRLPLEDLPEGANVVRLVAKDHSLDPDQWLALTPPRVPTLAPMNSVISPETPGLLDWPVALQFPCQRTFGHYAGVTEIAEYRISPDHPGKKQLSPVQNYAGGGVMGLTETVSWSYELPGYLVNDPGRDWGSMEVYQRRTDSTGQAPLVAEIDIETITRSGLWKPSTMHIATQPD